MCATPCQFVPTSEEVADALIDVSVNTAECRPARSEAEVGLHCFSSAGRSEWTGQPSMKAAFATPE
jgi:hypothetical protein